MRDKHRCVRLETSCAGTIADSAYGIIKEILTPAPNTTDSQRGADAAAGVFLRGPDQFRGDIGVIA